MKTLKKIKLNGATQFNEGELTSKNLLNNSAFIYKKKKKGKIYILKGGTLHIDNNNVLLLIIMELLTIKSVLAAEIQLVDVLLMVVILYLEQLYNNEPCSKYAVR